MIDKKINSDFGVNRSKIILAAIKAQITLAEQFGMQAAESLTNPYALGEMGFSRRKEGDQVSSARTDVIHGKRFRTGWTADVDDFSKLLLEVDKGTLPVPDQRADHQEPFTGFILQFEREPRMPLEYGLLRQNRVPVGTVALRNNFLFAQVFLGDDLPFLCLMPAKQQPVYRHTQSPELKNMVEYNIF